MKKFLLALLGVASLTALAFAAQHDSTKTEKASDACCQFCQPC